MAGDIEDFLRRAAQRRQQRQAPAQQRPAPAPSPEILDAEVIDETPRKPQVLRGGSVGEHVTEHISEGVLDERLSHLMDHFPAQGSTSRFATTTPSAPRAKAASTQCAPSGPRPQNTSPV